MAARGGRPAAIARGRGIPVMDRTQARQGPAASCLFGRLCGRSTRANAGRTLGGGRPCLRSRRLSESPLGRYLFRGPSQATPWTWTSADHRHHPRCRSCSSCARRQSSSASNPFGGRLHRPPQYPHHHPNSHPPRPGDDAFTGPSGGRGQRSGRARSHRPRGPCARRWTLAKASLAFAPYVPSSTATPFA